MGLSVTLSNALTGLSVNQQALTVLSQNIANANTAGYSKQTLTQQSVYLDGHGSGVSIEDITRSVDAYLNRSVQTQSSSAGMNGVIDDYNSRLQLMIGQPGNSNSIDAYIGTFFNTMQSLSQTPQDSTLQRTAVNAAVGLARQFSELAVGLNELQFQADKDIATAVTTINADLQTIHDLNITISGNKAVGKSVADLEDRRDAALKDLSSYLDVSTYEREDGSLSVTASSGISLLDDNFYQLSYQQMSSAAAFADDSEIQPIYVNQLGNDGVTIVRSAELVSGGTSSAIVNPLSSGKITGLLTMRDEQIPNIIEQLDTIAAGIRDQVNALHNAGSGFPGAATLTGTRALAGDDHSEWTGSVRIALVNDRGLPIESPYPDETNGVPPLTLDLETLDGGDPTLQDIVDAINRYFGTPKNKVTLGNLNNIQMVSASNTLPGTPPELSFGFDIQNISGTTAKFYVTNVVVEDNAGGAVSTATLDVPTIDLATTSTYATTSGQSAVVVSTTSAHGLSEGDVVYLSEPTTAVGGIPAGNLSGYFVISNVTENSFEIETGVQATSSTTANETGMTALSPYATAEAGEIINTNDIGLGRADLSANTTAPYYNVTATVGVVGEDGEVHVSQITYRINNQQSNVDGVRFSALSATGDGEVVTPTLNVPLLTAKLVNAAGVELSRSGGRYLTNEQGYLKISAYDSDNRVVIDSNDTVELGRPNANPAVEGSGRNFSHYFELNNLFVSNAPVNTGDTVAKSARNMAINSAIKADPGLFSVGTLTRRPQSSDASAPYNHTYEINIGDNTIIRRLSDLANSSISFGAAGGLSATSQTFSSYAGQIIGSAATVANIAKTDRSNADVLLEGYTKRASSISGVNLDVELANTVVYQNAYAASARVITVVNTLFDTLLNSFG